MASRKVATGTMADRLARGFLGGSWNDDEVLSAVAQVLGDEQKPGWKWSVGTRGSIHYAEGWAATREEAEANQDRTFRHKLAANPACGTFDSDIWAETTDQFWRRLEQAVAEVLNSD